LEKPVEKATLKQSVSKKFKKTGEKPGLALKIAFLIVAVAGILLHSFAMYLTSIITFAGTGKEGNPLFYLMGSGYFVIFGFAVLIGYYGIEWLLRIPIGYKILGASWLTALTALDFFHDWFYLMGYTTWPLIH
jgi:hypothetical protein